MNRNLTADEIAEIQKLNARFENRRAAYIKRDGKIFIDRQYPDLDELSGKIFRILSGGADHIVLTEDWIKENATELA